MSEVVNGSLDEVLGFMKESRSGNVYSIFIPSLNRKVMFGEMTTKHQKTVIKTMIDNPIYNSEFIFAIREIIKDTCTEAIDIDSLNIIDKMMICLKLRLKSVGDEFTYHFKNSPLSTVIKVSDYISKLEKIKLLDDYEIDEGDVKIVCGYPTIGTEYALEHEFRSNINELNITGVTDVKTLIGDTFVSELVKYIKKITIMKGDVAVELDMNDYTFKDRITIIEEVGMTATKKVLDRMAIMMKEFRSIMQIELELDDEQQEKYKSKKLTSKLEAGSGFFIIT